MGIIFNFTNRSLRTCMRIFVVSNGSGLCMGIKSNVGGGGVLGKQEIHGSQNWSLRLNFIHFSVLSTKYRLV